MIIFPIFAPWLYSFQHPREAQNEYDRLMDLWTNPEYLIKYARQNQSYISMPIEEFVDCILADAENLEEALYESCKSKKHSTLNLQFRPLHNSESPCKVLSLQKNRCRFLRLYAIKIDKNCFVITGGAIKLTQTMQAHPDTNAELSKLNRCKDFLQTNGIFDTDSFFEFIS